MLSGIVFTLKLVLNTLKGFNLTTVPSWYASSRISRLGFSSLLDFNLFDCLTLSF